ncbi:hypothetical protein AO262_14505 [Pseudomonas fluorescens ABAC62]|nr:hypothetical protein AO262_14505 [Pseudomonas fluorescens ABAC62]
MEEKFAAAAVRHFRDADTLAASNSLDGAGHLIGFSAECALKHAVLSLRPGVEKIQKHFPDLVEVAKRHLDMRAHHGLYIILKNPAFMQNWTVGSRYSEDGMITRKTYDLWRSQTRALMYAAKLRG